MAIGLYSANFGLMVYPRSRSLALSLLFAVTCCAASGVTAQTKGAYPITTVAGNGTAGYVPAQDGGPAVQAELDEPYGTAVDGAGNLYIADKANHRVRKVEARSGLITTVAGDGSAGYSASQEGHAAIRAQLNEPRAVAVDLGGNLYIADTQNHRIRKVDAGGTITTIAGTGVAGYRSSQDGGPAADAQLDSPRGLAVDEAGNLYIADYNNHRIRRIAALDGTITTVAGNGNAGYRRSEEGGLATNGELNHPTGIAVDQARNLYIADTDNHRVRRVDHALGTMVTVAGNGTADYSAHDEGANATRAALNTPTGVTVDATGNLYIADFDNNRIRKVAAGTHTITTLAGVGVSGYIATEDGSAAANARLNKPRGVTVDRRGNLFIADFQNSRIRKVVLSESLYLAGN